MKTTYTDFTRIYFLLKKYKLKILQDTKMESGFITDKTKALQLFYKPDIYIQILNLVGMNFQALDIKNLFDIRSKCCILNLW